MTQIIGVVLVRNEDLYMGQALRNIKDFCDEILVFDHCSTDRTWEVVNTESACNPRIRSVRVQRIEETQVQLEPYYGTSTWVFGVDGDEIYDPVGLRYVREHIRSGEWDQWFHIYGNVLNCIRFDRNLYQAWGHLAPPAKPMNKLYNFFHIKKWNWSGQRLHGTVEFRADFNPGKTHWHLYHEYAWEKSPFRCLHMALMRRSSIQWICRPRFSPSDQLRWQAVKRDPFSASIFLWRVLMAGLYRNTGKDEGYRRGPVVVRDVRGFFL